MSNQSQMDTLFAYHWHTTRHLMACAGGLDETGYLENPGYGHGSIHDLFFHLVRTNNAWRLALETGSRASPLRQEEFPDLASLQSVLEQEQQAWQVLLDGLGDEAIEGTVDLTDGRGNTVTLYRWRILQHLVLHGMQHHAELAQLLTAKGQSPGNIDFLFYS